MNPPLDPTPASRVATASTKEETKESTSPVTAVIRSLQLLEAFGMSDAHLSLAELSRRTGLHKTTALRLARTLAAHQYLVQRSDGHWRLGRSVGWLGACYQAAFNVQELVEPALRELSQLSGESASLYIREGLERTCLVRVEGPQAIRHHVRIGAAMPLHLGAPGRVILAFSGEAGEPYESIRRKGFHLSIGERDKEVASISAPVFGVNWQLLGSICISGPTARLDTKRLLDWAPMIVKAANQLSYAMTGKQLGIQTRQVTTWHP
jgi:DNA-binding IclR family transcriptional regulator